LMSLPATSDSAGVFRLSLAIPGGFQHRSGYIVLHFEKSGMRTQDIYQRCDLSEAQRCDVGAVGLVEAEGASSLSNEEKNTLRSHIAARGNTLFVMPYHVIAAPETSGIDMELFRWSLETAINTRIQELEQDLKIQQLDELLPPIGLVSLEPNFEALPLPKQQAIGEFVSALAVISGIGQWKGSSEASEQVSIQSNFLVMPPASGSHTRLLRVRDADLPASTVNSIELADNLSPLWGHFALIAVAGRELERATAADDQEALKRIRAYLIAERGRLDEEETFKKNDLERLLARVEGAIRP